MVSKNSGKAGDRLREWLPVCLAAIQTDSSDSTVGRKMGD